LIPILQLKKIPLRIAWYVLILLASLLPAMILAPWLANQAHDLLLDKSILHEKMFHQEIETRLDLETKRLTTVLVNKSDPIAYIMERNTDLNIIPELLEKVDQREPMVNSTSIYDTHANLLFSSHQKSHAIADVDKNSPVFVVPMHQRVFVGAPSRLSDKHFEFLISVPLVVNNKVFGVMVSTININDFWHSIRDVLPKHHSHVYLIDGRGSLLIHMLDSQYKQGDLLSNHAIVRSLLAHKNWQKHEAYEGMENTRVFGIGTEVAGLGWGIVSEIPEKHISNPIVSSLLTLTIIVILLHLVFGILGLFFTRRLLSPISVLSELMQRVMKGGDENPVIKPSIYKEIDDLGVSFSDMMHEIYVREESLKKQAYIMDQLGESLIVTNADGVIEYVNSAFTEITGYSFDEVVGKNPRVVNSDTQSKEFYKHLWGTILAGNAWEGRLVNRRKDGTLYPTMMSIAPVYQDGELTNFIAVEQDMSEQTTLEDQLRQAQKMEAIGTLVGGIAHDFNNMLAGITGNLYLAKKMTIESSKVMKKLENIESLSFRAADMIKQLLTFARQDIVRLKTMDLTACVREALSLLHATMPENIIIHDDICWDNLSITGDETKLHQVLMNLMNNARDALDGVDKPSITVHLSSFSSDGGFLEKYTCSKAEKYAHISVADNGMGIPEEHLKRLYEPFFTTKEEGKGTGLGLSMVFGAVETHQGLIDVESEEGVGTTFHIYIPLLESSELVATNTADEEELSNQANGELILLADDELQVRETTAEVLLSMGYKVLQAADGVEAQDIFNRHQECRLVILDVVMPHCGGVEAAKNIRKINADIPIIFISGYDREKVLKDVQMTNSQILDKPIELGEMSSILSHMLSVND